MLLLTCAHMFCQMCAGCNKVSDSERAKLMRAHVAEAKESLFYISCSLIYVLIIHAFNALYNHMCLFAFN